MPIDEQNRAKNVKANVAPPKQTATTPAPPPHPPTGGPRPPSHNQKGAGTPSGSSDTSGSGSTTDVPSGLLFSYVCMPQAFVTMNVYAPANFIDLSFYKAATKDGPIWTNGGQASSTGQGTIDGINPNTKADIAEVLNGYMTNPQAKLLVELIAVTDPMISKPPAYAGRQTTIWTVSDLMSQFVNNSNASNPYWIPMAVGTVPPPKAHSAIQWIHDSIWNLMGSV